MKPLDLSAEDVVTVLRGLRIGVAKSEAEICRHIAGALADVRIASCVEYRLGPRCRVDFYLPTLGLAIEVKKGKPNSARVTAQVERYASFDSVAAVILVVERSVADAPLTAHGKPVHYVALNKNWGIAL